MYVTGQRAYQERIWQGRKLRRKGAGHDIGDDDTHLRARGAEPDRDLRGILRGARAAALETARRLDRALSGEHSSDERDRVLLSVPWHYAGRYVRHPVADPAAHCAVCALRA